jgi:hypothetical protein
MKNSANQNVLTGNVKMDTQTVFNNNGNINIYPCIWEDKEVTPHPVAYRGKIMVKEDGTTCVKRYNEGGEPRYHQLYTTAHGEVKSTRGLVHKNRNKLVVRLSFPLRYPLPLIEQCFADEADEVRAYLRTRKEDTQW